MCIARDVGAEGDRAMAGQMRGLLACRGGKAS